MPVVYGVMTHEEHPGPDVLLLLERLRGVSVEAPTRTQRAGNNSKTKSSKPAGVASAGQWRLRGAVVDNTQENLGRTGTASG